MALYWIALTALLLSFTQNSFAGRITLSPSSLILSNNGTGQRVEVRCSPPQGISTSYYFNLFIKRVLKSSPNMSPATLARQVLSGPAATTSPENESNIPGSSVEGSLTGSLPVRFIMPDADCEDDGMYICETTNYNSDGSTTPSSATANLSVSVGASQATITADPSLTNYQFNQSLLLRCNMNVGTVSDPDQVSWVWEYSDDSATGTVFPNWVPANDMGTAAEESSTNGICQSQTRVGTFQRYLLPEDAGREYRCYAQIGYQPGNADHAAKFRIINVLAEGESPDTGGNTGDGGSVGAASGSVNVGAIVGGLVGGLIVIVIVVVLVYFLVIRKRQNKGDDYATGENDANKPADETVPYTGSYPDSAGVTYSKPNRFRDRENRGVSNKGMDEPTSEKPPPGYEPKPSRYDGQHNFRKGGRNPGYYPDDHEPRGHRYSSDDGGTHNSSAGDGDPNLGTAI